MTLKWDHSFTRRNPLVGRTERVRQMYFQDHKSAQELTDTDNRFMEFREVGSESVLARAFREGRQWFCCRWDKDGPKDRWVATKEQAVDFMLGR